MLVRTSTIGSGMSAPPPEGGSKSTGLIMPGGISFLSCRCPWPCLHHVQVSFKAAETEQIGAEVLQDLRRAAINCRSFSKEPTTQKSQQNSIWINKCPEASILIESEISAVPQPPIFMETQVCMLFSLSSTRWPSGLVVLDEVFLL